MTRRRSSKAPSLPHDVSNDSLSSSSPIRSGNEYIVEVHRVLTPETIEAEFENILKVHRVSPNEKPYNPPVFVSAYTTSHSLHINGSFRNTKVFREVDDTFIPFSHETILISSTNLTQFWIAYEKYKNNFNIVIDSRLQLIIMYATLAYADELLVYNTYTTHIVNLYEYCSDLCKIVASELNIRQIQELFMMKMIISYFLYDCSIPWQVNQLIANIKELHKYHASGITNKSIIDIMINYIKCSSIEQFNRNNVLKLYELFHTYFDREAYRFVDRKDLTISRWKIEKLSIEDVYVTFMLLKQSNFMFIKNDNM